MTKVREGVPIPAPGAPSGEDEGVDAFNDLLDILTRCLPAGSRPLHASRLHLGRTARLRRASPGDTRVPVAPEHDYVDRMIQVHIEAHTTRADAVAS